ncbi:uncharacterized protein E0L32_012065 [Thyridium curvatum]|uniref:Uncharacterized protein n=1 Tax=Thyridium curvatum TaxID=1093900 RepID=A0A507BLP8_9PEZI|nr:uncharacterized protein E0L32_012065 [Thyridium curvatum]TPX17620.1 hypothetical protein E0L32_012065 [Thyridium curvatum]
MTSITSITSLCSSVANRAAATATEVEEAYGLHTGDEQWADVEKLGQNLKGVSEEATNLERSLERSTAVSITARSEILNQLQEFERALAAIDKQARRLGSVQSQELDVSVVEELLSCLKTELALLGLFQGLLEVQSVRDQDAILNAASARDLLSEASHTRTMVLQRRDIIRTKTSTSADLPPQYSSTQSAGSSSQGASGSGFLSSLANTWNAVTSAMRLKPEPLVSPLCQATLHGDTGLIKGLLSQGANINGKNEDGKTALFCAIDSKRVDMIEFIIEQGANLTTRAKNLPPLFYAAQAGDLAVLETLLQHGADPNEANIIGRQYFIEVIDRGNVDVIRLLLDHGANLHARDITGRGILIQALQGASLEVVRLLLERGSDANERDITGRTALVEAILQHGNTLPLVKLLLDKGADPNVRDITSLPIFSYVLDMQNIPLARLMLEHGADPNAKDLVGQSMFNKVVEAGNKELARVLLDYAADTSGLDAKTLQSIRLYGSSTSRAREESSRAAPREEPPAAATGSDAPPDYESVMEAGKGPVASVAGGKHA